MILTVNGKSLGGSIQIPESKSWAHRLLIAAALSRTEAYVKCRKTSADIDATFRCLSGLGTEISRGDNGFVLRPGTSPSGVMPCGESGSTFRFMLPVACALGLDAEFILEGKLPQRPMDPLYKNLEEHGICIEGRGSSRISVSGRLSGGRFAFPGDVSSQFISGLIFALPLTEEGGEIVILGDLQSSAYVDMTLMTVRSFGIRAEKTESGYHIPGHQVYRASGGSAAEGDWSNAAFWLCTGAIGKNAVTCLGLNGSSSQGDRAVTDILRSFGAQVEFSGDSVTVCGGELRGTTIDAGPIPDLVPILSVVAAAAKGRTVIKNAARLRFKESDRLYTTRMMLSSLGGDIQETEDGLIIEGGNSLSGGTVDSFNDHRIAMSAAIASVICKGPVTIRGAEAVNKSYPTFFEDLAALGGKIVNEEEKGGANKP